MNNDNKKLLLGFLLLVISIVSLSGANAIYAEEVKPFSDFITFWSDLEEGVGTPTDKTGQVTDIALVNTLWNSTSAPTAFNYSLQVPSSTTNNVFGLYFNSSSLDTFYNDSEIIGVCSWINTNGVATGTRGIAHLRTGGVSPFTNFGLYHLSTQNVGFLYSNPSTYNSSLDAYEQNKSFTFNGGTGGVAFGTDWRHVCGFIVNNGEGFVEIAPSGLTAGTPINSQVFRDGVQVNEVVGTRPIGDTTGGTFIFGNAQTSFTSVPAETAKTLAQPIVFQFPDFYPREELVSCLYNAGNGRLYNDALSNCITTRLLKPRLSNNAGNLVLNYSIVSGTGTGTDNTTLKWFVNGTEVIGETTNTLNGVFWNEGDIVTVEAVPSDGVSVGDAINISYPFGFEINVQENETFNGRAIFNLTTSFPNPEDTFVAYYLDGFYTRLDSFNINFLNVDRYPHYSSITNPASSVSISSVGFDTSSVPQGRHRISVGAYDRLTGQRTTREVNVIFNNTGNSTSIYGSGSFIYPEGQTYPYVEPSLLSRYKGFSNFSPSVAVLINGGAGGGITLQNTEYQSMDYSSGYLTGRRGQGVAIQAVGTGVSSETIDCINGNCVSFDGGVNSFINGTTSSFTTQLTTSINDAHYSFWIKPEDSSQLSHIASSLGGAWVLRLGGSDNLTPEFRVTGADAYLTSSTPLIINEWSHIMVWNSNTQKTIYVNGVETGTAGAVGATSAIMHIGSNGVNSDNRFIGKMDEIGLWTGFTQQLATATNSDCYGLGVIGNCSANLTARAQFLYNEGDGRFMFSGFEGVMNLTAFDSYYVVSKLNLTPNQTITTTAPRFAGGAFPYIYDAMGRLTLISDSPSSNLGTMFSIGGLVNSEWSYRQLGVLPPARDFRVKTDFWNVTTMGAVPYTFDVMQQRNLSLWTRSCELLANTSTVCTSDEQGVQTLFRVQFDNEIEQEEPFVPRIVNAFNNENNNSINSFSYSFFCYDTNEQTILSTNNGSVYVTCQDDINGSDEVVLFSIGYIANVTSVSLLPPFPNTISFGLEPIRYFTINAYDNTTNNSIQVFNVNTSNGTIETYQTMNGEVVTNIIGNFGYLYDVTIESNGYETQTLLAYNTSNDLNVSMNALTPYLVNTIPTQTMNVGIERTINLDSFVNYSSRYELEVYEFNTDLNGTGVTLGDSSGDYSLENNYFNITLNGSLVVVRGINVPHNFSVGVTAFDINNNAYEMQRYDYRTIEAVDSGLGFTFSTSDAKFWIFVMVSVLLIVGTVFLKGYYIGYIGGLYFLYYAVQFLNSDYSLPVVFPIVFLAVSVILLALESQSQQ